MIYTKTAEEIEIMRESILSVSRTLALVAEHIGEGVTTSKLDKIATKPMSLAEIYEGHNQTIVDDLDGDDEKKIGF